MSRAEELLVSATPQETRVALVSEGAVQELHIERAASRGLVGNIYAGRVTRVLPGMQSAFIDIGLERAAFLHAADIRDGGDKPIEGLLAEGQPLVVQVSKDPLGAKGARLSTQISIAGRLLVYLPHAPHIAISQKIGDEAEREKLRERVRALLPTGEAGGFIIRTLAEGAADAELAGDIDYLRKAWQKIGDARGGATPRLLYQDLSLAERALRDIASAQTTRILVDSRDSHRKLAEFARACAPAMLERLEHYAGERPLFELYGVEGEIEKALARRVELNSGAYLVIEQTEAMAVIDVNTGGYVGSRSLDDTVLRTNLEAAQAIARQLRLRNLGGIIVIDFIDMESDAHRAAVLEALNRALARDRTRTAVYGFTALGLVEMTRKRSRESLADALAGAIESPAHPEEE